MNITSFALFIFMSFVNLKKHKNDNMYKNEAHEIRILTNLEYLQILQNIQINLPKNHILKFMMIS